MEPIRNVFITLEQFEEIQSKYDGVCEYLNGEILFSSRRYFTRGYKKDDKSKRNSKTR